MVYHKLRKFLLIRLIKINSDFITISKETTLVPSGSLQVYELMNIHIGL